MYQTFGFPPELFETMATEQGFGFDWDGFKREMEHHGEISGSAEKNLLFKDDVLAEVKKLHKTEFLGYETLEVEGAKVVAIVSTDGKLVEKCDEINSTEPFKIVLDKTPFYGEKGGQVGDCGILAMPDVVFQIITTQVDGDLILHVGRLEAGSVKVGDTTLKTLVEWSNRQAIARAHTATHLLHDTLRRLLGSHAEQQGSKVDADILRFDFTHHAAVDKGTLTKIEQSVNRKIFECYAVQSQEMDINAARESGAMMLFGEKYPEKVRVVQTGASKELCGGTHVKNTSEIGLFKIISESSVAAGIRRIEAYTGQKAVEKVLYDSAILQQVVTSLKIPVEEIPAKVDALTEQVKKLQKQLKTAAASGKISVDDLIAGAQLVGDVKVILWDVPNSDINGLRQLVDQVRTKTESVAMLFSSVQENKVTLLAGLSRDLVAKNYDAVAWLKAVSPIIGGGGAGGRPDMAQTGGKDPSKLPELFAAAKKWFE